MLRKGVWTVVLHTEQHRCALAETYLHRAAGALEAAQQLSEQQGGDQQEQAARAAQLQALAEGATAAAQSSQSEYDDAKAEGQAELKAINE